MTFTQFMTALRKEGYEIKTGVKYMGVRPPGKERFQRLKTLGDDYTEDSIKQRILKNRTPPKHPATLPEPNLKRGRLKSSLKTTRKLTGLQALYFHYLYKMGILPRNHASPKRTHFLLREDIRHMDTLIAQTRYLCNNHISSKAQLAEHQTKMEQKLAELYGARGFAYNRIRRCSDDGKVVEYKRQISGLSKEIRRLRREVKLCTGIMDRSTEMREKLDRIHQEEIKERKEEQKHEQQRSGRPDRQHES